MNAMLEAIFTLLTLLIVRLIIPALVMLGIGSWLKSDMHRA